MQARKEKFGISILMACYDTQGQYIRDAVDSVTAQGMDSSQYEILLVDDGSSKPDTLRTLSEIQNNPEDYPNVRIFHQENKGQSAARNIAIRHAKFEFLTGLDSDDTLSADPKILKRHGGYYMRGVNQLKNDDALAFAYCNHRAFYDDGRSDELPSAPYSLFNALTKGTGVYAITRRQDVVAAGGYPENHDCVEDSTMIISVLNERIKSGKGLGVIKYPERYYDYRQYDHGQNVNARKRDYARLFYDRVSGSPEIYAHYYGGISKRDMVENLMRDHFRADANQNLWRLKVLFTDPSVALRRLPVFAANRVKHAFYKAGLRESSPLVKSDMPTDGFYSDIDRVFSEEHQARYPFQGNLAKPAVAAE